MTEDQARKMMADWAAESKIMLDEIVVAQRGDHFPKLFLAATGHNQAGELVRNAVIINA